MSLSPYLQRICPHIIARYLWMQQAHVIITYRMTRHRQRPTYRHCSITVQRTSCQHWQPASVITCHRCLCVPPGIQHVRLMDSHCYPVDMSANVSLSVIFCLFDTLYCRSRLVHYVRICVASSQRAFSEGRATPSTNAYLFHRKIDAHMYHGTHLYVYHIRLKALPFQHFIEPGMIWNVFVFAKGWLLCCLCFSI